MTIGIPLDRLGGTHVAASSPTRAVLERDAATPRRPVPAIGLRRHPTLQGGEQLVGTLHEDLRLPAGTAVRLQRVRGPGEGDGPEFVALLIPPAAPWIPNKAELERLAADNARGVAVRHDPRPGPESP